MVMKRYLWIIRVENIIDSSYSHCYYLLDLTIREARNHFKVYIDLLRKQRDGYIGRLLRRDSVY